MSAPSAAAGSRAVGAATIAEAFRITAEDHPDRVAVRTKDDEVSLTWAELRDRVDALARGLHELGVGRATPSRSCSPTGPSSTSPTWRS